MNCKEVQEMLSVYIDGELTEAEAASVKVHLSECESCNKDYEFLKNITETAQSLPALMVSDALHASIMSRVQTEGSKPKIKRIPAGMWRKVSTVAMAAAVIALSVVSLNSLPEHPMSTPEDMTEKGAVVQVASPSPAALPEVNQQEVSDSQATDISQQPAVKTIQPKIINQPAETPQVVAESADAGQIPATAAFTPDDEQASVYSRAIPDGVLTDVGTDSSVPLEMVYYFSAESYQEAVALLEPYPVEEGAYVVPMENRETVCGQLESLSGYLRHDEFEVTEENLRIRICQE